MSYRLDRRLIFGADGGERVVWAERRESSASDDVTTGDGAQFWRNTDSRYIVRALGDLDYNTGHRFYDEDGELRTIRGIRKSGRTHYEILARKVM